MKLLIGLKNLRILGAIIVCMNKVGKEVDFEIASDSVRCCVFLDCTSFAPDFPFLLLYEHRCTSGP